jgi:hypothetical protein
MILIKLAKRFFMILLPPFIKYKRISVKQCSIISANITSKMIIELMQLQIIPLIVILICLVEEETQL